MGIFIGEHQADVVCAHVCLTLPDAVSGLLTYRKVGRSEVFSL